jgi:D-glycerate 3-kinase
MNERLTRPRAALDELLQQLDLAGAPRALVESQCLPIARVIQERARTCMVVGISGAQGVGKSTLAELLHVLLSEGFGLRSVVVALDDYYLPHAAREELACRVHPLLATRGVPGTHDLAALHDVLRRLRAGQSVELLQFSKAQDDRLPETRAVHGPFDVVLFEGWCVGAEACPDAELSKPMNTLEREEDRDRRFRRYVNAQLAQQYAALWAELDMLVFIAAPDLSAVHAFRAQQERRLRPSSAPGAPVPPVPRGVMDDAQLTRFIQHFGRITERMLRDTPAYADVVVRIDAERRTLALEVAPPRPD